MSNTWPDDGERTDLLWPVGNGWKAPKVYTTYGQPTDQGRAIPHLGVDMLPPTGWRDVYAIESGVVLQVNSRCDRKSGEVGILVESKRAFPGKSKRAFLYLHLDPLENKFHAGDEIRENQRLGTVIADDGDPLPEHLHLTRIAGANMRTRWRRLEDLSVRNPLALVDERNLGDGKAPVVHGISLRRPGSAQDLDPRGIRPGPHDIIVWAEDSAGRARDLGPYDFELRVREDGGGVEVFRFVLDGALNASPIYAPDTVGAHGDAAPAPKVRYKYIVSCGRKVPGEGYVVGQTWEARSGRYSVDVVVRDVAGNQCKKTIEVVVGDP